MRRTAEQRQPHLDFVAKAFQSGIPAMEVARMMGRQFGLSSRQARLDVKFVLVQLHCHGGQVIARQREAEDLCLTLRRIESRYRDAIANHDHRTALKAEKTRCRLLGAYPSPRVLKDHEKLQREAAELGERQQMAKLAHARRKLRQAQRNGTAEGPETAETQICPPLNVEHQENCPCWDCNPLYLADQLENRRNHYPRWLEQRKAAEQQLTPLLSRWRGREDRETDEAFAARVKLQSQQPAPADVGDWALASPQPAAVEQRLAVLTKWLEHGFSRETCRRRYQLKFALTTRRLDLEWNLCLKRFDDEGRWLTRRRNESIALALGLTRREHLVEACLAAGDYKSALDVEIDRCRLLGLFSHQRQAEIPLTPTESAAVTLANLDPCGRGTGIPTDRETVLIAKITTATCL